MVSCNYHKMQGRNSDAISYEWISNVVRSSKSFSQTAEIKSLIVISGTKDWRCIINCDKRLLLKLEGAWQLLPQLQA